MTPLEKQQKNFKHRNAIWGGGGSFYQTIMSNKAVYKKNRSEGLMGYYYYYRWEKLILIEMNVMKRSFEFDDIPINIFIYKPIVFVSLFTFI